MYIYRGQQTPYKPGILVRRYANGEKWHVQIFSKAFKSANFTVQIFYVRNFGLAVIRLVSLIRYFGLVSGLSIFWQLLSGKRKSEFIINDKNFKNKLYFRSQQSDPFIFEQVFVEQQYHFPEKFNSTVKWIIDAGANIGMASVYFANKYPGANIISIEPDAGNFALLQKNTSGYPQVTCLHAALWDKEEMLDIGNKTQLSAGYIVEPAPGNNGIPGITLNRLLEKYNIEKLSIAKIDIEGSEREVFANDTEWIGKTECIIVEIHDHLKAGASKSFFGTMANYDWETYVCGENIVSYRR